MRENRMKVRPVIAGVSALIVLAGCNRVAGGGNAGSNNLVAPAAADAPVANRAEGNSAAAASAREPQEILCHMGRCTYLRIDKQETVREAGGERLLRVTSAEGLYPLPNDTEFPASSRGLPIQWAPQPNDYYVLCSATRPTLIIQKEAPARGWQALDLDFVDGVNFASMDFYVHYAAACHPGEKIDDGFAERHGFRNIEAGDPRDLAQPENVFNPRNSSDGSEAPITN